MTVGAFSKGGHQHAALETRFLPRLGCPMRAVARADSEPGRSLEEELCTHATVATRLTPNVRTICLTPILFRLGERRLLGRQRATCEERTGGESIVVRRPNVKKFVLTPFPFPPTRNKSRPICKHWWTELEGLPRIFVDLDDLLSQIYQHRILNPTVIDPPQHKLSIPNAKTPV